MDTACLRIKFTPLLQKNPKNNSKCCLEIVPEVSCIQNLDKLTWRQETNFIEYTIPMTYKVILKKRHAIQDSSMDVVKTYHSCVDLLHSSSKSTINLGSGDVSKIISDTFIITKSIEQSPSKEDLIDTLMTDCKRADLIPRYPVTHKTTNTSFRVSGIESKESKENFEDDKVNVKTKLQHNIKSEISNNASLDKITNTENGYPPAFRETVRCRNTLIYATKTSTKADSRRKLSLSPICSVSTQENPTLKKNVASKAVTCKIYDSQKDLVPLGIISTPSDLSTDPTPAALSTIIDIPTNKSSKRFKFRVPPEIRVAEYVQYMEKEVLPLKMLLDDILCKCSTLGLTFCKASSKQSLLYKTVSMDSNCIPDVTKSENKKSNRVVYSIVFDG